MGVGIIFEWLVLFFDQQFLNLLLATGLLFLVVFITWWTYKKLSTRNIFHLFSKSMQRKDPSFWDYARYMVKYFLFFPLLTFVGFLIFALSLLVLMKPSTLEMQSNVLFIAIIIVSTIRVAAYSHEDMAEDLAKLVPLSLIALVLSRPAEASAGVTWDQIVAFFVLIPSVLKYLLFIVILEMLLRGGTWLFSHLGSSDDASAKE